MSNSAKNVEVLAPAGGKEQLYAAVRSGADAVYFGASDFNARRNAENFSDEDFSDAVKYCRIRGVKTYIALNTLVFDKELPKLLSTLSLIHKSGADGVIVQDMAVASIVKKYFPSLSLHASTQMAVHNVSGAKELQDYGFKRIVLARELSLKEIEKICSEIQIETEAFVHGAHCMSVSGMCYMSSVFGGRSGNRGLCAQPCRLNFKNDKREYALSLKDMSLITHLAELKNAGVNSFKIEGRMKRPEYVAAAVNACREGLEGKAPDINALKSVFSRSGFTDGYLTSKINGGMFGHRQKEDVTAAKAVLPELKRLYAKERKSVEISVKFSLKANENAALVLSDGKNEVKVFGDVPETAERVSLNEESAKNSLLKLGDTPFFCRDFICDIEPGLIIRVSALNGMRREACDKLFEKRAQTCREEIYFPLPVFDRAENKKAPELRLRFGFAAQFFEMPDCDRYIMPLKEIYYHRELISEKLSAELPALIFPADEERISGMLTELKKAGLKTAVAENIGAVRLIKDAGLFVSGGAQLNILNSLALREYEALGCLDNTLSFELGFSDMKKISGEGKTGFIAYGHLPLMRFRSCPERDETGCGECRGRAVITDRRGDKFNLLCSGKRFSTLYNPIPLYSGGLTEPKTEFRTLFFTYESKEHCKKITETYLSGKKTDFPVTAGLYNKELL
ncbi:MAG: U32 family peptidase [Oscillospiraceae bacterium]|nr:U32 family peptidase [Oscillospiraceae bacterium]